MGQKWRVYSISDSGRDNPLKALGSVAGYLADDLFYLINDNN